MSLHTREKLDGSVCKCMDCAKLRAERVRQLAKRYGLLDQPDIDPRVLKLDKLIQEEYQL